MWVIIKVGDNMSDNPLDNIKDEYEDWDNGAFQVTCGQCACEMRCIRSSDDVLIINNNPEWDDFDQLSEEHDRLQSIYNPSGFHEVWHCSKKCQAERIAELKEFGINQ